MTCSDAMDKMARFRLNEPFLPGQTVVETLERPAIPRHTRLKPGPKKKTDADGKPLVKDVTKKRGFGKFMASAD